MMEFFIGTHKNFIRPIILSNVSLELVFSFVFYMSLDLLVFYPLQKKYNCLNMKTHIILFL